MALAMMTGCKGYEKQLPQLHFQADRSHNESKVYSKNTKNFVLNSSGCIIIHYLSMSNCLRQWTITITCKIKKDSRVKKVTQTVL